MERTHVPNGPFAELCSRVEWEASGETEPDSISPVSRGLLLPPIRIGAHEDVHGIIDVLNDRSVFRVLEKELRYHRADAIAFSMLFSELAQNIVEHADAPGWVTAAVVGPGRVEVAVVDGGRGLSGSLGIEDDELAIMAAMNGVSRFSDPGRGQGLKQVRKKVGRWGGRFTLQSGSATIVENVADALPPIISRTAHAPGVRIRVELGTRPEG